MRTLALERGARRSSADPRPGAPLQVDFRGVEAIEQAIHRVGAASPSRASRAQPPAAAAAVCLADRR